jgi:hypothetical protein
MDQRRPGRSMPVWIVMVLLLIQAIGGIGGGASLALRPDGSIMQIPVSYLDGSPFSDYLVPGLCLLVVLGLWPLVTLAGLWLRRAWAWYSAFAIGCGLVIFELVEIQIIPYNWMQPVFGVVGAFIALLSLLPATRRYAGVRLWPAAGTRVARRD